MSLMIIHVYVFEHKPSNFIDRNLLMSYIERINLLKKSLMKLKKRHTNKIDWTIEHYMDV